MNSIDFVSSAIVSTNFNPKLVSFSKPKIKIKIKTKTKPYSLNCSLRHSKLRVSATIKDQNPESQTPNVSDQVTEHPLDENGGAGFDLGWLPAFPHVLVASMSNFTFGYHIGSVPLSISVLLFVQMRFKFNFTLVLMNLCSKMLIILCERAHTDYKFIICRVHYNL